MLLQLLFQFVVLVVAAAAAVVVVVIMVVVVGGIMVVVVFDIIVVFCCCYHCCLCWCFGLFLFGCYVSKREQTMNTGGGGAKRGASSGQD